MTTTMLTLEPTAVAFSCAVVGICYGVCLAIYNVFFHPLRHFPGPKLAAASRWYEFYYDVVKGGKFVHHFAELHDIYGPVVRISPHHLHINDPDFYHRYVTREIAAKSRVFTQKEKYTKAPEFYANLGIPDSLATIIDVQRHRIHRSVVSPTFSPATIRSKEPLVSMFAGKMMSILSECDEKNKVVNATTLVHCFTVDVVTNNVFGEPMGLLDSIDTDFKKHAFVRDIELFADKLMWMKHFNILNTLALNLPKWVMKQVVPGYLNFREWSERFVAEIQAKKEKGIVATQEGRATIFDYMLEPNPAKKYVVPCRKDLIDAAFFFLLAGSDTTAVPLAWALFYLAKHPEMTAKIRAELSSCSRNENREFDSQELQALPYMSAWVEELLRVRSGIPGPLPRIVPAGGVDFEGRHIPAGVSRLDPGAANEEMQVSLAARVLHDNPKYFPDPHTFNPDRFTGPAGRELAQRYNVTFSRGPRACMGRKLAYMEIFLTVAMLVDQFDLELYHTREDIPWHDYGIVVFDEDIFVKVTSRPRAT